MIHRLRRLRRVSALRFALGGALHLTPNTPNRMRPNHVPAWSMV
ncbi:hypothetical protein Pla52o_18320 [Novipirellula galeiformis]|uniref:Uncharacterized protein n=1 Tax=Novipirellula galeiformis TaxID=2528004 RepID=A0A5C6CM36_9BACT|nr:hypothetical protein Pla52o_18320 [Novipirellula galeiformis]